MRRSNDAAGRLQILGKIWREGGKHAVMADGRRGSTRYSAITLLDPMFAIARRIYFRQMKIV